MTQESKVASATLSAEDKETVDRAMLILSRLATATSCERVSAFVRSDGLVEVYGDGDNATKWSAFGDLEGGAEPTPSKALERVLNERARA